MNLNSEFYEDAGDPLAKFRKKRKGAAFLNDKNGVAKDPFANDPDVLQTERSEKLREDCIRMNLWY